MSSAVAIGDEAPNFDLTSTEDVVIMLRDEVPRSGVLLYLFADPEDERVRHDLEALASRRDALARLPISIFGVSPAKLDQLKETQRELSLPFPLLRDDRGFSASYGVEAAEDGSDPRPALVVVDRQQRIVWMANPVEEVAAALDGLADQLRRLPSTTSNYPRSVVNRLIDRWVN